MHVVQYIRKGNCLPIHEQCMKTVEEACKIAGVPYVRYDEPPFSMDETQDYRFGADLQRLRLATIIPDMFWVDADTICYSIPDQSIFESTIPYFNDNGYLDISYFYVNNYPNYFEHLLALYEYKKPTLCGWVQTIINKELESVRAIPKGHFQHLSLSRMLLDDHLAEYGTSRFKVVRKNGQLELIIF